MLTFFERHVTSTTYIKSYVDVHFRRENFPRSDGRIIRVLMGVFWSQTEFKSSSIVVERVRYEISLDSPPENSAAIL